MFITSAKEYFLVSKYDISEYPNDALPFFYNKEEPYEVKEEFIFPDWQTFAFPHIQNIDETIIGNDIVPVQPMQAPMMQMQYVDYTYDFVNCEKIIEEEKITPRLQRFQTNTIPKKRWSQWKNYFPKTFRSNKRLKR